MSTGWEWVEDSMRRGEVARLRRMGVVARLKDRDGDPWLQFNDATVSPDNWGGGLGDRRPLATVAVLYGPMTKTDDIPGGKQ